VDPDAQSPGESILRLRWLDIGLPRPKCQVEVPAPAGRSYWLDIGLEEERFGAEYDGEEFHTEDDGEHDEERREWMRRTGAWTIVVARKANIHGPHQDIDNLLRQAVREAGLRRR
jgi:very-short-patch-repair endonuclease